MPKSKPTKQKTVIALFNYGGGMRGLIPAHFMAHIEKVTGLHMADMVDIFAGPSTGAILNAALNVPDPENPTRPKFKASHMVRFYEQEGIKIFPPDKYRGFRGLIHDFNNRTMKLSQLRHLFRHGYYNPANFAEAMNALYGSTKLSDTLRSVIVPFYNLDGGQLEILEDEDETDDAPVHTKNNFVNQGGYAVWLKNMKFGKNPVKTPDISLFDAIMASTAAPTYFPCHHFCVDHPGRRERMFYSGIDGSIFDNPCITYHGAIRQHLPPDTRLIMVLLGTGHTLRSFKKDDWNNFGGLGVVDPVNDLPLINILFHASETALVESFAQELGDDLFVFNKSMIVDVDPSIAPNTQIDDASPENLRRMERFFQATLEENKSEFERLCHLLVSNYEQRQNETPHEKSVFDKIKNAMFKPKST
jgi:predicted acylesterase/phospholipase RssA/heat shock protein HspQ